MLLQAADHVIPSFASLLHCTSFVFVRVWRQNFVRDFSIPSAEGVRTINVNTMFTVHKNNFSEFNRANAQNLLLFELDRINMMITLPLIVRAERGLRSVNLSRRPFVVVKTEDGGEKAN